MDFLVEKNISNFVESQFPQFYQEEGPDFILFVKTYYEWLEQSGNPVFESRSLFDYRDIDNTLEDFLYYFQKKYLYGIPFDVIINKRYLLKHILDVYRSKSSIQGYKLLFRLIYNEDVDVYLPGRDILKASDGTWKEPRYLEVTNVDDIESLIGNEIIGASSGTVGVVEKIIKEPIDQNIICTVYLSNISPKGGNFLIGEKIYDIKYQNSTTLSNVIQNSPKILGSLDYIDIINGGDNFKIGDILKIIKRDISNNQLLTYGIDGVVKISSITRKLGALSYSVPYGGFGYTNNALTFLYKPSTDTTGYGSSYSIGSIYNAKSIIYNTDIISDYMDVTLNSTAFGITGNTSANLISTIGTTLSYSSNVFGSVATLTNIKTGNAYTQVPYTFVKETLNSKNISGSLSYNTTSNTITGTSTNFTRYFTTNSVIYIQANATLSSTGEYHVIKNVVNTTSMELYTSPSNNSTPSTFYKVCPETLKSNFAIYEDTLKISNVQISSYSQLDANVYAVPSIGNSSAQTTLAINSGKGYIDGEFVKLYLYSGIETPTILVGGTNYQNNEKILFYGGEPIQTAEGYIETDSNGSIISTTVLKFGSGYKSNPNLAIKTVNGNGAVLTTNLREFNTSYEITGRVVKTGLGREKGYWTTTRGFLDSDKYIQDSYYYQDYSYQLDVALTLDKYKNILYNTFHTAGTELFGKYILKSKESISFNDVYDEGAILKTVVDFNITADATLFNSISLTVDNNLITADMEYGINYNFTMDRDTIKVDSDIYTTDLTYIATIL